MEEIVKFLEKRDEPLIISIEGNISSGKTSFMNYLKKVFSGCEEGVVEFIDEGVEKWVNCGDRNFLKAFYEDKSLNGYAFQTFVFITRLMDQDSQPKSKLRITERSPFTDYMFCKNLHLDGILPEIHWEIYKSWYFKFMARKFEHKPHLMIYLDVSAETCMKRKVCRSRDGENDIPLSYFKSLKDRHDEWMPPHKNISTAQPYCKYIRINAEPDFTKDPKLQQNMLNQISTYLKEHF